MTNESASSRHVARCSPLIGCRSPLIVVSPPPLVTVDQTFTFVINCTAMGIPTPQVQNTGISKIVKTVFFVTSEMSDELVLHLLVNQL